MKLIDEDRCPGLQSVALVETERFVAKPQAAPQADPQAGNGPVQGETETERRYLIFSLEADAEAILGASRRHWHIENQLHWGLDVRFSEDASHIRKRNGPENVSVLRRIAMNMIRQDERPGSLRQKRKRAGWDDEYREQILKL